ncbi:polysaccharide biosynthesis tyrosine autokinase [Brevibacterium permense]|uniref:polysaccharide biosynthesis tyrosine autokinase n=1 Tax=Brevibacterium permense TaxID=234834 RepID=UPI0021D209B7|nr:polysaccharide biosynthesis tyrosine autokinase [Brevibacterium permense]MCU4295650.1 polysaccharide biosynthesis tyrosine autokinase [Brevibacterium permense]
MKIPQLLRLLRRHLILLVVTLIAGGVAGFGISALLPPTYSARTELFVSVPTSGDPYEMRMASDFIKERIQTYVGMVGTESVLEPVVSDLDLDTTPGELASRVEAISDPETVLITIQASADDADSAARLSTAVSRSLTERISMLENPGKTDSSAIDLIEANEAVPPTRPDGLPRWLFIPIGALLGLAAGIAVAVVRGTYDNVVRTKNDLAAVTSVPLLAAVPEDRDITYRSNRDGPAISGVRGESILRLRTNLCFAHVDEDSTVLLVSSSRPGEGKTTVGIDLAIASARAGHNVVLVDADLRRPTVAARLGLEGAVGLTTALVSGLGLDELLQTWGDDDLHVLAAGQIPPNPTELLETRAMSELVSELAGRFDLVIIDSPPLLPVADGLVLSKLANRTLLVAAAGGVKSRTVAESVRALDELGSPIGLVLNRAEMSSAEVDRHRTYGIHTVLADGPGDARGHGGHDSPGDVVGPEDVRGHDGRDHPEDAEGPGRQERPATSVGASVEDSDGPETRPMPLVRDDGGYSRS